MVSMKTTYPLYNIVMWYDPEETTTSNPFAKVWAPSSSPSFSSIETQ